MDSPVAHRRKSPVRSVTGLLVCALLLSVPVSASGQDGTVSATRERLVSAARVMIEKAPYATLISLGLDGHPQARVVDPFPPDSSMVVWIGTNPLTRKVGQIRSDPRVTISYMDPKGTGYVTLFGTATIVTDPEARSQHFKDTWKAFYPGGPLGDGFVLIRVDPFRLEVLDYTAGLTGDPQTWTPSGIDLR